MDHQDVCLLLPLVVGCKTMSLKAGSEIYGHGSHLTYNTVMLAIQNDIIIICLPPNCSHALQPLDVGVFKNLKVEWKKILKRWFRESRLPSVDKAVFPGVLKQLWLALSADDAIAGFRGSGIVPLDLEKMKRQIVLPDEMGSPVRGDNHTSDPVTPCSTMRKAVRSVLAPAQSNKL